MAAAARQGCCLRLPFLELDRCRSAHCWRRVREWSASVPAPRLRKLVRLLGRRGGGRRCSGGKFQYDPLSYALNFHEGREEGDCGLPDFYARYVAPAAGGKVFARMAIGSRARGFACPH